MKSQKARKEEGESKKNQKVFNGSDVIINHGTVTLCGNLVKVSVRMGNNVQITEERNTETYSYREGREYPKIVAAIKS